MRRPGGRLLQRLLSSLLALVVLTAMGGAQLEAGKWEAAARSLERAVALDPSAWTVRLLLGRAYQQLGRLDEAERELTLARKGWANQGSVTVR